MHTRVFSTIRLISDARISEVVNIYSSIKKIIPFVFLLIDQVDVTFCSSDLGDLITLIKLGNIYRIRQVLERGDSPDGSKSQEIPPLHESVYQDNIEICQLLISYNVDLNQRDKYSCTALHRAVTKRSFEMVKLLVTSGADVNVTTSSGFTPAMLACNSNGIDVAEYLVNISTAKFDSVDKYGNNILHCLCANGNIEHFDIILSFIKKFVDRGISINALNYDGHMLLDFSYRFGVTFAKELITIGADVTKYDADGRNYLNRYLDLDLNAGNYLIAFVKYGFGRIPKNVRRHLINEPDRAGKTAFMRVCGGMFNSVDVIQMFCDAGADINAQNHLGESPLHLMSRDMWIPDKDAILYLLQQGANVNAVDIFGRSPIFKMRKTTIIQIFIDFKADLKVKDKCGRSPLMGLLVHENAEQIQLLVKNCSDCNLQDIYGSSPLHYVAWYNSAPIAHVLLQSGADVNLKDQMGRTPYDLAKALGNLDVALVLMNDSTTKTFDADHSMCRSRKKNEIEYDNKLIVEEIISPPEDPNEMMKHILQSSGIGKSSNAEAASIARTIFDFVSRICDKVGKMDYRFQSSVLLSGSSKEESKVGDPNEFDFVCCLDTFSSVCILKEQALYDKLGLVQVRLNDKEKIKEFHHFFNDDFSLNAIFVSNRFFELFRRVLEQETMIWSDLQIFYDGELVDVSKNPTLNIVLIWTGSFYKNLKISLDIVPALRKEGWWPQCCKFTAIPFNIDNAVKDGCFILLQTGAPSTSFGHLVLMRCSLAPIEHYVVNNLPSILRDSYALAKSMRSECVCPPIMFNVNDHENNRGAESVISSYMLKNSLLHAAFSPEFSDNMAEALGDPLTDRQNELIRLWTLNIYNTLEKFTISQNLPAYFMPDQNVFTFADVYTLDVSTEELEQKWEENTKRRLVFIAIIKTLLKGKQ